jgi:DNA polymerase-3 subunit gamma/tau
VAELSNSAKSTQYTVMARRFRPQTFDEVVGQEHVGQALRNAIRSNRVAHAYLFTGARGVGKTSTARIFAKALNCPHVVDAVPCNQCEVCDGISSGSDVDVIEIDGASNRGIDDIRQLRANVNVRSMRSPNKVYIIDEVHMLTKEAFNALLKTLEEPPPNVKFVFCTTEANKVPDTILSRCQRFDFGTIATASIANRLRQIAEADGKQVEEAALELVARRAAGSMRDSQSLFDQLLAFGGEVISEGDVHQLLGTAPDERLIDMFDRVIERRRDEVLQLLNSALSEGVELGMFSDQMLAYLRDLMIVSVGAQGVPLISVSERSRPRLVAQSEKWGIQTISAAMQLIADAKVRMQRISYGRPLVELTLVRMSLLEDLDDVRRLIDQVAGNPGAVPVATPRAVSHSPAVAVASPAAVTRAPSAPPEPVKKNSEIAPQPDKTPTPSQPKREFSTENWPVIWSEVLLRFNDASRNHLVKSTLQAISGPNLLEIVFPRTYSLSKTYVNRPDLLKRIADAILDITGVHVSCRVTEDQSSPAPAVEPASPVVQEVESRRKSSVDDDPFVQQAVEIFSAKVADVRTVLVGQPSDE